MHICSTWKLDNKDHPNNINMNRIRTTIVGNNREIKVIHIDLLDSVTCDENTWFVSNQLEQDHGNGWGPLHPFGNSPLEYRYIKTIENHSIEGTEKMKI